MSPELLAAVASAEILSELDLGLFDGVYLGQPYCLKTTGNFLADAGALGPAIEQVKARGLKAYVTTPVLPLIPELRAVDAVVGAAVEAGADGVEVHDMGVFRTLRGRLPDLRLHLSHYANVYNAESAMLFRDLGAARLVPGHELMMTELETIAAVPGIEVELAVHGKLPLGFAHACFLTRDHASGEPRACRRQCEEAHMVEVGDWRMRCAGFTMVTEADFSLIEHLPGCLRERFAGLRLETQLDDAATVNAVGQLYRTAIDMAATGKAYPAAGLAAELRAVVGELCNGWRFGLDGRGYQPALDDASSGKEDPWSSYLPQPETSTPPTGR